MLSGTQEIERISGISAFFASACTHQDSYVGSMGYYILTGRRGAWVFQDSKSQLIVCQHPHIPDRLMIFPEMFGDGTLTARVLCELDVPQNGIQLARYTQNDLQKLELGLKKVTSGKKIRISEREEPIMDWKYPARVLDTAKVANLEGNDFDKVRNKYNKVASQLEVIPLHSERASAALRSSLMFWIGAMIYAGKETGHDLTEFYETLFQAIKEYPAMFDGFIVLVGEEPAGFTIWDRPENGVANAIAGLSRKSVKGMSEFQTITACRILNSQGVHSYNMGGSETENLDRFKLKFLPKQSVSLQSYEVFFESRYRADISVHAFPKINCTA